MPDRVDGGEGGGLARGVDRREHRQAEPGEDHHRQIWQLVVLTALQGTVSSISFPAMASVLPQMVPRDQLKQANLLMSVQRNALTVIGPAVSGVLVVTVGAGWALAVDGVTYLAAAALLVGVRIPPPPARADRPIRCARRPPWQ